MTVNLKEEDLREAIENTCSMLQAAVYMKVQFSTFKRYATKYGLYEVKNQSGKGTNKLKREGYGKYPLSDILAGLFPYYGTYKLKHRLYDVGLKENKCESCGIIGWNGKVLECELDHIDGDRTNHKLENLMILCPNCHSQTGTFRNKTRDKQEYIH